MSNIRFVIDAACDLMREQVDAHGIVMCGAGVHIDGREFTEKLDITNEEFYAELQKAKEIPTTSHVSPYTFQLVYTKAWQEGITDIVHVTIHSGGSNTLGAARLAAQTFFEENPTAADQIKIHHVDSNTYSIGYGYPTLQAAKMAQSGADVETILAYLEDWFDRVEIFFAVYTLEYVRKSGRVSAAAALAGDLLGLKPIIRMTEGVSTITEKLRGERKIIPHMTNLLKERLAKDGEYFLLKGTLEEPAQQASKAMAEAVGYPPTDIVSVGPSIAINAGPKLIGLVFKGEARGHRKG